MRKGYVTVSKRRERKEQTRGGRMKEHKVLLIIILIASFVMFLTGSIYFLASENACECQDCYTQRFFLFEEVEQQKSYNITRNET